MSLPFFYFAITERVKLVNFDPIKAHVGRHKNVYFVGSLIGLQE